jgi:hypothetical protein
MNLFRKLLAAGVLAAAFTYSTPVQADDCDLECANWACDTCNSCSNECFFTQYYFCIWATCH